jgi:hypothetical protein
VLAVVDELPVLLVFNLAVTCECACYTSAANLQESSDLFPSIHATSQAEHVNKLSSYLQKSWCSLALPSSQIYSLCTILKPFSHVRVILNASTF